jgi:hypothetical protein
VKHIESAWSEDRNLLLKTEARTPNWQTIWPGGHLLLRLELFIAPNPTKGYISRRRYPWRYPWSKEQIHPEYWQFWQIWRRNWELRRCSNFTLKARLAQWTWRTPKVVEAKVKDDYLFADDVLFLFLEVIRPLSSKCWSVSIYWKANCINHSPDVWWLRHCCNGAAKVRPLIQQLKKARAWDSKNIINICRVLSTAGGGVMNPDYKIFHWFNRSFSSLVHNLHANFINYIQTLYIPFTLI